MIKKEQKVVIVKDGPYLVSGGLPLAKEISIVGDFDEPEKFIKGEKFSKMESYSLCRCGKSKNKPFCDGAHVAAKFKGKETADDSKLIQNSEKIVGGSFDLKDIHGLCSMARFCHLGNGTWQNVVDSKYPNAKKLALQTACNCPSGRLVIVDKKGKDIEPKFKSSISLLEDPQAGVSGPIWLKGGISFESADGKKYETRNRVTLCRCGKSKNKPFCDGSHIDCKFNDGDESLK